jgi:hypothetical protein
LHDVVGNIYHALPFGVRATRVDYYHQHDLDSWQGIPLVHFSALCKHFVWDK